MTLGCLELKNNTARCFARSLPYSTSSERAFEGDHGCPWGHQGQLRKEGFFFQTLLHLCVYLSLICVCACLVCKRNLKLGGAFKKTERENDYSHLRCPPSLPSFQFFVFLPPFNWGHRSCAGCLRSSGPSCFTEFSLFYARRCTIVISRISPAERRVQWSVYGRISHRANTSRRSLDLARRRITESDCNRFNWTCEWRFHLSSSRRDNSATTRDILVCSTPRASWTSL